MIISILMLKLCDESICKAIKIIFKSCLTQGTFPLKWNKGKVAPIHKKTTNSVSKLHTVSLLPACSKVFKRFIYNTMLPYFTENNIISKNKSGFQSGDSCQSIISHCSWNIFQLWWHLRSQSVIPWYFKDFWCFKIFQVWHESIIHKLKCNGEISGNLLSLLTDFFRNRKQRVIFNGQSLSWANISAGVPQGSIIGPLLFLIDINDLSDNLQCNLKLIAGGKVPQRTANNLNSDLKEINKWAFQWKICFKSDPKKASSRGRY